MKTPIGWSSAPDEVPTTASQLLTQAATILTNEVARLPVSLFPQPSAAGPALGALPKLELPTAALPSADVERLRRQAHDVIESLLSALVPNANLDHRAALVSAPAPVEAGTDALVCLRIANEDPTPCELSLYSSNFVADRGYDISASHVVFTPRVVTIPAQSEANFEIKVRVPRQAPPGIYSGLVQVMGNKYLKVVVSVEVK